MQTNKHTTHRYCPHTPEHMQKENKREKERQRERQRVREREREMENERERDRYTKESKVMGEYQCQSVSRPVLRMQCEHSGKGLDSF